MVERIWAAVERARAEQAWRDNEERFQSLAENLPMLRGRRARRADLINQHYHDFRGHDAQSKRGMGIDTVHRGDSAKCERLWVEALRVGEPVAAERRL